MIVNLHQVLLVLSIASIGSAEIRSTTTIAAYPFERDSDDGESVSHQLQVTGERYDMTIYHWPNHASCTASQTSVPESTITMLVDPSETDLGDGSSVTSEFTTTILPLEATSVSILVETTSASLSYGTTANRPRVGRSMLEATTTAVAEPPEAGANDDTNDEPDDDTDDDKEYDTDDEVATITSTTDDLGTQEVINFTPVTTVKSTSTLSASGVVLHSVISQTGTITEPAGVTRFTAYTTVASPSTHIISKLVVHESVACTVPSPTTFTTSTVQPPTMETPSKQVISFSAYTTVSSLSTFVISNFVLHVESTAGAQPPISGETTSYTTSSPSVSTIACTLVSPSIVTTIVPPPQPPVLVTTVTSHPGSIKTCLASSAPSGPAVDDRNRVGPGINNVPIRSISGIGEDGKKVTYPNMHGSTLCKKAKRCVAIDDKGPVVSCLEDLKNKIHYLATNEPDLVFEPMQPIACSPALNSKYCAFIELVPWQPKNGKNTELFNQMNTVPYRLMEYNQVPIGAIAEGIDWMKKTTKAKLCGSSLLPVPEPGTEIMGRHEEKGKVYVLRVDVNPGIPPMDKDVMEAYAGFPGSKR